MRAITAELHPGCDEGRPVHRLRGLGFDVSVEDASIHRVPETLGRLVRNRRRVVGLTRLKLVVLALHALGGPLLVVLPRLEQPRLNGFYATRPNT